MIFAEAGRDKLSGKGCVAGDNLLGSKSIDLLISALGKSL